MCKKNFALIAPIAILLQNYTLPKKTITLNKKIAEDEEKLYVPFLLALTEGRVDFVNLFLEDGLDIKKFLTAERLGKMYFNTEVINFIVYIFIIKI
jgi:hypothetical protein